LEEALKHKTLPEIVKGLPPETETFDAWFWGRCRRLGIEQEFRAKFEEWRDGLIQRDRERANRE
jgi:hypothetical protein